MWEMLPGIFQDFNFQMLKLKHIDMFANMLTTNGYIYIWHVLVCLVKATAVATTFKKHGHGNPAEMTEPPPPCPYEDRCVPA